MRAVLEVVKLAKQMHENDRNGSENEQFDAGYRYAAGVIATELMRSVQVEADAAKALCDEMTKLQQTGRH